MNYEAVCRTAPATPGLSITYIQNMTAIGAPAVGVTAVRSNLEF